LQLDIEIKELQDFSNNLNTELFTSKATTLKEKRLLIVEQPLEKIIEKNHCSPYETIIEPLTRLLKIFEEIRVA